MARTDDLEANIRESYRLIREYERKEQLSDEPKEKIRCRDAIAEQRQLLQEYLEEYIPLCKRLGHNVPADLREIIAPSPPRESGRPAAATQLPIGVDTSAEFAQGFYCARGRVGENEARNLAGLARSALVPNSQPGTAPVAAITPRCGRPARFFPFS